MRIHKLAFIVAIMLMLTSATIVVVVTERMPEYNVETVDRALSLSAIFTITAVVFLISTELYRALVKANKGPLFEDDILRNSATFPPRESEHKSDESIAGTGGPSWMNGPRKEALGGGG